MSHPELWIDPTNCRNPSPILIKIVKGKLVLDFPLWNFSAEPLKLAHLLTPHTHIFQFYPFTDIYWFTDQDIWTLWSRLETWLLAALLKEKVHWKLTQASRWRLNNVKRFWQHNFMLIILKTRRKSVKWTHTGNQKVVTWASAIYAT